MKKSSIQSNKQIYETCPIHPKEYLQVVCMQCQVNSIACPLCIDLSHKNHPMMSLKKFVSEELPKLYDKKPEHRVLEKGINQLGCVYLKLFDKMKKKVNQEMTQLDYRYQGQIQALRQENNVICGVGQRLYTMKNISLLKKKIKSDQKIPETRVFNSKIEDLCEKMQILVGEVTEDLCEIIRGLKSFWNASKQLLLNSKRQFKFIFSPSLKHKSLMIEVNNWQGRKIINELYDNSYHIGVVEPPLNPFKNQIQFRVQKSTNKCAWIGICDLRKIIDRRFSNCYKKGEGAYWIWQAGGKGGAQHFSSMLNDSQTLPWNFDVGDVVKVRLAYDKESRYVQFQKNGHKVFRAKLDKANVYCACVAMGAEQESIAILQD